MRWICPQCQGGVNGPQRMRKDDTRRFCLVCSAKAPRLVERTCPVLDKQRDAKRAKAKAKKEKAKADLETLAFWERDDLIQKEFRRLKRLKCWRDRVRHARLVTIRRSSHKRGSSGHAYWHTGVIKITVGVEASKASIGALLLHELAHVGTPKREGHSDRWRALFVESAREGYGIEGTPEALESSHDLHRWIRDAIEKASRE